MTDIAPGTSMADRVAVFIDAGFTPNSALAAVMRDDLTLLRHTTLRAAMSGASMNNLPDSAFAYVEPGGKKDASGKTTPRSLRHFPLTDKVHVQNALARAPQSPFGKKAMPAILAAAKKFGVSVSANSRIPAGSTRADMAPPTDTPPSNLHVETDATEHNEHDVSFLFNIANGLQGLGAHALTVLGNGQHAEVAALATSISLSTAGHSSEVARLQQRLGVAATSSTSTSTSGSSGAGGGHGYGGGDGGGQAHSAPQTGEARSGGLVYRSVPFQMASTGDGLTLEGYAAVFNSRTRINSWEGDFEEQIAPGAFARSLSQRSPVLMFEHGRHPLIGSMPLGVITSAREDAKGLFIQARLSDNWLIQPVRDAVKDGAVTGMSFRFSVPEGGDTWEQRSGNVDLRTVKEVDCSELGPVVFPAYEPTTASIRSLVDKLPELTYEDLLAGRTTDFTGRSETRSPDGGDQGTKPRKAVVPNALPNTRQYLDEGALRARGII